MSMTRIAAELKPWGRQIDLYYGRYEGETFRAASPVEFVEQREDHRVEPFMSLHLTAAQELMDELWRCGLRPSEGSGSAGSLAATERHLADMRRLVFKGKP
jgi:hypothetical protein